MTSDETPREPREGTRAPSSRATGATGNTDPADAGSTGSTGSAGQQESGPPGALPSPGGEQNGASAEQRPQTWPCPPNGGGQSRAPGRLPASTWLVTLLCTTMYTMTLALILIVALLGIVLDSMAGGSGTSIAVPAGALALTVFLFWAVRLMLVAARFPRPTAAMVLFTVLLLVGFAGSVALPSLFGFIESADGVLAAAVAASVLAALMMLVSRGVRVRWAAAASAAVLVVACVVTWTQSDAQEEPMPEEQQQSTSPHG